jgi:CO/xanthine dehydrogenase Mo-binding subunit
MTSGSRVTFRDRHGSRQAGEKVVAELRARAAMIWDVDVEGVIWEDGRAKLASSNVGDFAPLSFRAWGGEVGMAPGFSTQFRDVDSDPETRKVTILRFAPVQNIGCALPSVPQ